MKKILLSFFFLGCLAGKELCAQPGALNISFNPGTGIDLTAIASAIQPDGKIIIGGNFQFYNGTARGRIARINADGTLDASFNPGTGANNTVYDIIILNDGKIIIGGAFTSYNGTAINCIARLNADGTLDPSFNTGTGPGVDFGGAFSVEAAAIQNDGKIIIGGGFTSYNGTARNHIARINADGSLDGTFNPGTGAGAASDYVETIAIQNDGKIVIGGWFTTYNGTARNYIARINANGSLDGTFNPGTGADTRVRVAAVQSDGKIIIGGNFTSYNGTGRNYITRINPNGTIDGTFNPGSGGDNNISAIAIQNDGKIIIGGLFTSYNGTGRNRIARLNADGSLQTSFNPGTGADNFVGTISLQNDGKIIIGGSFVTYNGTARGGIARIWGGISTTSTSSSPASAVNNCIAGGGTISWTTPNSVTLSDNVYAVATFGSNNTSSCRLQANNFGFAIPAGDIIDDIEVLAESFASNALMDSAVYLIKNGIVSGNNAAKSSALPVTETLLGYDLPNLWGLSLTPADINAASFGVAFVDRRSATGGSRTANIDQITVKVFHHTSTAMAYVSSAVSQVTQNVNPGISNAPIIRVEVITSGDSPSIDASSFTFSANGTTSLADVLNAKLYYTGANPAFSPGYQLGSTVASIPGGNFSIGGFSQNLLTGVNYFWLSMDVAPGATIGNVVDAECSSLIVGGISRTPTTTAPSGSRLIASPDIYSVGASQTYPTIQAAYNAIPLSPSNTSLIEIYNDYNSASETFPITFGNKSNANNIVVRPATSAAGIICQGLMGSNGLWIMDGAQNIVIDGRAGGTGITKNFTVRNTQNTTPFGTAFLIRNDAKNISFRHLILESETTLGASLDGVVTIGTTTGSSGNDNINFSNCMFRDLSAGGSGAVPFTGVYSSGTAGKTNDFITVDSCHFNQGGFPAVNIFSNSGTSTITNNHVYFPGVSMGTVSAQGISIASGGNHTIAGNFIGGSSPNCGGAQMNISAGSNAITGILISATGNNTIENNVISNLRYTTTYSLTASPLVAINVGGSGNYTVGGNLGNTIGNMAGTGSVILTHNGSNGIGFVGINCATTGTVSISSNNFGAISQTGTRSLAEALFVLVNSGAGAVTINGNTFGSTAANNISITATAGSGSPFYGIRNNSTNGITITNNTFQNINHTAINTYPLGMIYNVEGSLTCTGNTFKNITSASSAVSGNAIWMINHQPPGASTATISNNLIQDIAVTATVTTANFYGISINTNGNATCNNNTIGSVTANNISIASNANSYGIYHSLGGSFTCNNNTIQEFNLTSTGVSAAFYGIANIGGASEGTINATGNTIKNIDCASGKSGDALFGIYNSSTVGGHVITKSTMQNFNLTASGALNNRMYGIFLFDGSGGVTKNFMSGFTNQASGASAQIFGIDNLNFSWDNFNNVILLDNSPNTNAVSIFGIGVGGAGNNRVFHNTVKIGGTVSAGNASSYAFQRNASATDEVKNNLFQNLRTGGTGSHYAEYANSSGSYQTNYNYLEVAADQNKIGNYGSTDYDFVNWKGVTGATNDLNSTTTLDAIGVPSSGFVGANAGTDLFTPTTVVDDRLDNPRDPTPTMGGYEVMSNTITTTPFGPQTMLRCNSFSVTFSVTGTFNAGNMFKAELSDASGSFIFPTTIGTLASTTPNPITCIIPGTTPAGTQYRIRVVSTNPVVNGTDNLNNLTIAPDGGAGPWVWQGTVSADWFDRCNWDMKTLPDGSSDVNIPGGTTFQPSISGAAANCKTITINTTAGAIVNLNSSGGGVLNITQ